MSLIPSKEFRCPLKTCSRELGASELLSVLSPDEYEVLVCERLKQFKSSMHVVGDRCLRCKVGDQPSDNSSILGKRQRR